MDDDAPMDDAPSPFTIERDSVDEQGHRVVIKRHINGTLILQVTKGDHIEVKTLLVGRQGWVEAHIASMASMVDYKLELGQKAKREDL